MPSNWAKGFTKYSHPSVRKISQTMIERGIDNFAHWREAARKRGILKSTYQKLRKNTDLAELLGVVYGDGNIEKFPRTERLVIAANSKNTGFVRRYASLVERIFNKEPRLVESKIANCTRISIYEKYISKRLGIPSGNKSQLTVRVPSWIRRRREYLIAFLRGLYEAEGSLCVHRPTSTYKLLFSNKNKSLLNLVFDGLIMLGFHPHRGGYMVQLSRREEVYRCAETIGFRRY